MEITKREIMVASCIAFIILSVGMLLFGFIQDKFLDTANDYDSALKIDANRDLFNHAISTRVGNTLVYGDFKTSESVTFGEIKGSFMSITKVKEVYTMHTITSCNGKTCTTSTYWTWDYAGEENKSVKNITFLGNKYNYNMFDSYPSNDLTLNSNNVRTSHHYNSSYIYENSIVRYYYCTTPTSFNGTIFVNTGDGYLKPYNGSKISINGNMKIDDVIKQLSFIQTIVCILYWVVILGITAFAVYKYVEANNYYLEN